MLTRRELALVKAVLALCGERDSCLTDEKTLLALTGTKPNDAPSFGRMIDGLEAEGYLDVIRCEGENGKMLCLTPKVKARCYGSERRKLLSSLIFKIALAALGSVAAFVFTRLLYRFF
ncbi:MAG: hypothetical protein SOT34_00130 [Candidatus Borkfalkiaceae bacterium]|nr:hypothetical protein [Christensenellaceae bacterium]